MKKLHKRKIGDKARIDCDYGLGQSGRGEVVITGKRKIVEDGKETIKLIETNDNTWWNAKSGEFYSGEYSPMFYLI